MSGCMSLGIRATCIYIYIYIYTGNRVQELRTARSDLMGSTRPWDLCGARRASADRPLFPRLNCTIINSSLGSKNAEKHLPSRLQSDFEVLRTALGAHLKTYGIYGVGGTLDHLCGSWHLFSFLFILQAPTFPGF